MNVQWTSMCYLDVYIDYYCIVRIKGASKLFIIINSISLIFIKLLSYSDFQMKDRGGGYWLIRRNRRLYTQCCTSLSSGWVLKS